MKEKKSSSLSYILGMLLFAFGLYSLIRGGNLSGLGIISLGLIVFPPVGDKITAFKYATYLKIALVLLAILFIWVIK